MIINLFALLYEYYYWWLYGIFIGVLINFIRFDWDRFFMSGSKPPMRIEDLERLVLVSDPKVSPDEKYTVFTVSKASLKDDKYISSIWLLDNDALEYEQLTSGPSDNSPEWSPDARHIAFLSRRTLKEDEAGSELWIYNVAGRYEPRLLVKLDKSITNVRWSPDGKKILFLSQVGKIDEDVKVIEEIPIWFNGKGFTYGLRTHVFVVDVASGNVEQVTKGDMDVIYAEWSPDGSRIAYIASEDMLKPYISNIHVIDLEGGLDRKLTKDNMSIWDLDWSPDGKYIAFRGHDLSWGLTTHYKIWLLDVGSAEIRLLTDIDLDVVNAMNSDVRGPTSSRKVQWVGEHIYFALAEGGSVGLYRVDLDGNIEAVIKGDFTVEDYSVADDLISLTIMNSVEPPEVYIYSEAGLKKVTGFNEGLLNQVSLNRPMHFRFKASDGAEIDGWILKPYGFRDGEKYPAILYIHGGPPTTYGESFIHEFHVLSGEGFVVIFTNPRGSTGYSQEFKDIRGRYGDRDYKDLMEAVDYVIENFDFVDPERLGVTGGSYGGFMTNWIVGHTNRFKAAVTQRSISNWISDFGTTDIGFYFNEDQIAGGWGRPFWDEQWFDKYWDQSPIKYVAYMETPLLIIHSIEDYRCWLDQALQLFTALKYRGVPTRLVLFPKENHNLSRTGKPKHRVKRLEEIVAWFKKYLVGEEKSS